MSDAKTYAPVPSTVSCKLSVSTKGVYTWEVSITGASNPAEALAMLQETEMSIRQIYGPAGEVKVWENAKTKTD